MLLRSLFLVSKYRATRQQLSWAPCSRTSTLSLRGDLHTAATVGNGEGEAVSNDSKGKWLNMSSVDHSFIGKHLADDGRTFEFATVVVNGMARGISTQDVWQHACSLLGSEHVPTFGVTFVSRPSVRAIQVVRELSESLALKRNSVGLKEEVAPMIGCMMEDIGDFRSSESHQGFSSSSGQTGGVQLDLRRISAEGEKDEDEDTISDWEEVCTEYLEDFSKEKVKVCGEVDEHCEEEEADVSSSFFSFYDELSREDLHSLLMKISKPPPSVTSSQSNKIIDRLGTTNPIQEGMCFDPRVFDVLLPDIPEGVEAVTKGNLIERNGSPGVFAWTGDAHIHSGEEAMSKDGTENFKLILCLGYMPRVRVVPFHTLTTGIPQLPDLATAITTDNPHMMLLGAPGFIFPDFIRRLCSVFPLSCRAGAFLAPVYTGDKKPESTVSGRVSCPLFFGSNVATTGVVGLAISGQGKGDAVPVDAFAELVRMSLAMPRIPGYVFLDERVSTKLFLPKNSTAYHASGKVIPVQKSLMLEQLRKKLSRENSLSVVGKENFGTKGVMDGEKDSVDGASESEGAPADSTNSSEPSENWKNLPLALFDAVLFPGWSMPFHIFEPCYRSMVRSCVDEGKAFGLACVYNASWTNETEECKEVFGTLADLKVHAFQADCSSYIIAHGVRRFRVPIEKILAEPGAFGMVVGEVQFFDDKPCNSVEAEQELKQLAKQAVALCRTHIRKGTTAQALQDLRNDPVRTSFAIGHLIDVPTRVKRRWLQSVDTKTRLLEQIAFLEMKTNKILN